MNIIKSICTCLVIAVVTWACSNNEDKTSTSDSQIFTSESLKHIHTDIEKKFSEINHKVIQPAEGYLKYPYLIPAGFYKQMWDWDGFFMGNHFISQDKPEYMKYWALNLLEGVDEEGYVSGCATTEGPRPIFGKFSMKPFLSQGVYFAAIKMNDFSWVEEYYERLTKVLEYRDLTQLDTDYGLYFWDNAMQSGADNNPALNYFWQEDHRSYLAPDASTFQLKEILAQEKIAEALGKTEDAAMLKVKAEKLEEAINKFLWCEEDQMYYTVDRETGDFYRHISYSSFIPLIQKLAPQDKGEAMIKRYLLNPDHMKAEYGFRTLSRSDPEYNNKNIIKPFSNWQGPVWPIANYLYSIGLKQYGFEQDLNWLAGTLGNLLSNDIEEWGSMHENYHADTGAPLAPANDYVDENGKFVGFISWNLCIQNLLEGVVNDEWMLLEIN
ncbi:MAG: trehalase family glycosidase [Bacteroidales bacterium]|nr:trehalase family glycosidase [Bacteroidales bacterium]